MSNTSNSLALQFYMHAYGQSMGRLHIYIDDSSTSRSTGRASATCVASFNGSYTTGTTRMTQSSVGGTITPASIDYTGISDDWTSVSIDLGKYRT